MGNLIKNRQINLPKEVSSQSRNIFQANSQEMIKNIADKNVVVNSIHQAINRCVLDKGINMSVEELNYLKLSLTDDILREFSVLSLQDISLCFSMGVRGNLGEYFGLNVVTFYGWLKKYREELIPQTIKEVEKFLPPVVTKEEVIDYQTLDLEKVSNICSAISYYSADKKYEFNDFGNIHYNFLTKHNLLNFTDEEKEELLEDAKSIMISEVKNKNHNLISKGKIYHLSDVNQFIEKMEYGDKDMNKMIEIQFKKLMVKKFITNFPIQELDEFKYDLISKINLSYGE